jgi:hypothetical protein
MRSIPLNRGWAANYFPAITRTNGEVLWQPSLAPPWVRTREENGHGNGANRLKRRKIEGFRANQTLLFTGSCTSPWKSKPKEFSQRSRRSSERSGENKAHLLSYTIDTEDDLKNGDKGETTGRRCDPKLKPPQSIDQP